MQSGGCEAAIVEREIESGVAVEAILRKEALDPFDLSHGPLIRCQLLDQKRNVSVSSQSFISRGVVMQISLLQAKLHRVRVTRADLHYEGSCGIDEDLLEISGIREFQHLEIYNIENGERLTTYAIKSPRGSKEICLNGAAARKAAVGDHLIICAYSGFNEGELAGYRPTVVLVDDDNRPHRDRIPLAAAAKTG